MPEETKRIRTLRDSLLNGIFSQVEDVYLNGHPEKRLINNLNISLKHTNIDRLLIELRDIAVSTGSACSSGNPEGSYVLKALGLPEDLLKCSIRFGLGRFNTEQEISFVIEKFAGAVKKIRQISYYS
jgi:cysteine desulfurase